MEFETRNERKIVDIIEFASGAERAPFYFIGGEAALIVDGKAVTFFGCKATLFIGECLTILSAGTPPSVNEM